MTESENRSLLSGIAQCSRKTAENPCTYPLNQPRRLYTIRSLQPQGSPHSPPPILTRTTKFQLLSVSYAKVSCTSGPSKRLSLLAGTPSPGVYAMLSHLRPPESHPLPRDTLPVQSTHTTLPRFVFLPCCLGRCGT